MWGGGWEMHGNWQEVGWFTSRCQQVGGARHASVLVVVGRKVRRCLQRVQAVATQHVARRRSVRASRGAVRLFNGEQKQGARMRSFVYAVFSPVLAARRLARLGSVAAGWGYRTMRPPVNGRWF